MESRITRRHILEIYTQGPGGVGFHNWALEGGKVL